MRVAGLGKVDRGFLKKVVLKNTGSKNPSQVVGPGLGLDNAVVSIGGDRVLIITSDPLSIIPSIGMQDSAWLTVHELASDLTTSSVRPEFAVFDYNLPPSLSKEDFAEYFRCVSDECRRLGIAIVGGHTGWYPGCDFTIVGGGVMMGASRKGEYLTPAMAGIGHTVIVTKGAAIEATGVLARAFPVTVEENLGATLFKDASAYLRKCSTVEDALTASSVGLKEEGVTSMHDATEGGVLGALYELAQSSGRRLVVDEERIPVSEESEGVCGLFGLDPLVTLSEGALLITCVAQKAEEVLDALRKKRIQATAVGRVEGGRPGLWLKRGRKTMRAVPPKHDPYWDAYASALKKGWK